MILSTTLILLLSLAISYISPNKALSSNDLFLDNDETERTTGNCECGVGNRKRIVGGFQTLQNSYPWLVTINWNSGLLNCGGSVLNNVFILTASHCFLVDRTNTGVIERVKPDEVYVLLGDYDRSRSTDVKTVQMGVQEIITHEEYGKLAKVDSDIALVRIKGTITFSDNIKPICLPPPNTDYVGEMAIVVGYGKTSNLGSTSNAQLDIYTPILPDKICQHNYSASYTKNMICGGFGDGVDGICKGDSGGPLMMPDDNSVYSIIGIVSFYGYKCAEPDYHDGYTKVANYIDWIHDKMKGSQKCTKASKNAPSCGTVRTSNPTSPVTTANNIKYPWTAIIFVKNEQNSFDVRCEATLISKRWLITSARCVNGYSHSSLFVLFGDDNHSKHAPESYIPIKRTVIHPNFEAGSDFTIDMALVKLNESVNISEIVSPVCLADINWESDIPEGTDGVTIGLAMNSKAKEQLVAMTSKDTSACRSFYGPKLPLGYYMCTNGTYGTDVCDHDFGGHFSIPVGDMYRLTGLQAYSKNFNCTANFPVVFVSIPYFLRWITVTTGIITFT